MRFSAVRITQPSGREVFAFAATAEAILEIAEISRMRRGEDGALTGYQRPEVASHIAEIRKYLHAPDAVIPNTVVIAFDTRVFFTAIGDRQAPGQPGELTVPKVGESEDACGFVVDGQQRLAAIASSDLSEFPIFATAIIAPDVAEQRRQFVLVNRTKPLPQGLIYELLPEVSGALPSSLAKQQLASALMVALNMQPASSLFRLIRTPTCPVGMIKDNSIRRMLVNSLSDGALCHLLRKAADGQPPVEEMVRVVATFWGGVKEVFKDAWGLPPNRSRLTHGAGVMALGYVMDHLYLRTTSEVDWTRSTVAQSLSPLRPYCAWTEGTWQFPNGLELGWNDLQNTDRDVRILTNHFRRLLEAR